MRVTLSWLRRHLETEAGVDEIARRLVMLGLEVDEVVDRAAGLEGFVVARVVAAEKHPAADRLTVCRVDAGGEAVQVVCGAPNARAGMKGVFAAAGSHIPGTGVDLEAATIRGVESRGMLLSEREMGISDDHETIIELAEDAPVGARAVRVMGLDDPVIDVAITPNRGDCLGVRGIARDLAAAGVGRLKPLVIEPVAGTFESPVAVRLDFDGGTRDACPYFVGRMIRGVNNGESPKWLRDTLVAVGLRPISALVDITNLLTLDLARPLHAFDAERLEGDLHVRLARAGERVLALNGREYVLDGEMCAIADEGGALALGGVIGGEGTGCTRATTDVFLEAAYFDPVRTAATGRKLELMTDARYRFERGVDPTFLVDGIERATRLVLDLCGGEPSDVVVAGSEPPWRREIRFRPERVRTLGGVRVAEDEITRILTDLGFEVAPANGALWVAPPPWRGDIVGEACLVEEVVRIHGYDRVPAVPLVSRSPLPSPATTAEQRRRNRARRVLAGRGLVEAVTFSFVSSEHARLFGGGADSLRLVNPISTELVVMRPSQLPNLIAAAGRNAARGIPDAALFEVGPCYAGNRPDDQSQAAAGIRSGRALDRAWTTPARPVDAFDAKADALAVLAALGVRVDQLGVTTEAPAWYHPGRSGVLGLGPESRLAAFGEIHPRVLRSMDVKGPVVAFEVALDELPKARAKTGARPPLELSPLQPVERDFAFVLYADVPAAAVVAAARGADKGLIAAVSVFDVYSGGALGDGKKSLAIGVTLQPRERTLTDAEIEAVARKVVARVEQSTGGALRE